MTELILPRSVSTTAHCSESVSLIAGLLYGLIHRTRLGMIIRAGASNREMVASLGINIKLMYRFVFALGVALAAFAGMIAAPVWGRHWRVRENYPPSKRDVFNWPPNLP